MQILASKLENLQKSPLKHYIEKPYLPSFVNLFTTFCPRLCEETNFIPDCSRKVSMKKFYFLEQKLIIFWVPMHFQKSKNLNNKKPQIPKSVKITFSPNNKLIFGIWSMRIQKWQTVWLCLIQQSKGLLNMIYSEVYSNLPNFAMQRSPHPVNARQSFSTLHFNNRFFSLHQFFQI